MQRKGQYSDQEQLLKVITKLLQKAKIPYMVTGALSVVFYGRPRASHDIDFVIEAEKKDIEKLKEAFKTLPSDFIVQKESIEEAILHKMSFNIIHLPTMLKLDFFLLKDNEFDRSRFGRRKMFDLFGQKMVFASAEDTILIKLLWYKDTKIEKHLIDAAFVYQVQENSLDHKYLLNWAKKHKTTSLLQNLSTIDLSLHY